MPSVSPGHVKYVKYSTYLTYLTCASEREGLVQDAVVEIGEQEFGLADGADVRQAAEQLAEHDLEFHPGQVGAQAHVRTGTAEADMLPRVPGDVEDVGVLEHRRIAVGRRVEQHHLVALLERVAVELEILAEGTSVLDDR